MPEGIDNIATVIDPTYPTSASTPSTVASTPLNTNGPVIPPTHAEYNASELGSSPVPPYMPIQGTRRNNMVSQPDKKKKSKDKCTHQ